MDDTSGEIFISYKSERRRAAEHLAETLRRHGYTVWFDYQLVKGRDFARQIDARIRVAKALIVLWCTMSVRSEWVGEEVDLAKSLGTLIPTKIEDCDLPVGDRRKDYIDLIHWDGSPRSHQLDKLLLAVAAKAGRDPQPNFRALQEYEAIWRRFGGPSLEAFALEAPLEASVGRARRPTSASCERRRGCTLRRSSRCSARTMRARGIVSFSPRRPTLRRRPSTERLCHGVRPSGVRLGIEQIQLLVERLDAV
jgi:hypothetical protein